MNMRISNRYNFQSMIQVYATGICIVHKCPIFILEELMFLTFCYIHENIKIHTNILGINKFIIWQKILKKKTVFYQQGKHLLVWTYFIVYMLYNRLEHEFLQLTRFSRICWDRINHCSTIFTWFCCYVCPIQYNLSLGGFPSL